MISGATSDLKTVPAELLTFSAAVLNLQWHNGKVNQIFLCPESWVIRVGETPALNKRVHMVSLTLWFVNRPTSFALKAIRLIMVPILP